MSAVEKEIVELLRMGDVRAMELLYDHYADSLYGVVFRMIGDEAKSADLLQECFVKIWQNSKAYDPKKGRLFTWLMQIVRNRTIDEIRKEGRKKEIHAELRVVGSNDRGDFSDPTSGHDLRKILSELDESQRELIEHSFILGYSHPEIAKKFDLPLGTVKTRIRNGMKKLQSIFGNGR